MTNLNAVARDRSDWNSAKPGQAEYLRYATKKSGRGAFELVREMLSLQLGRGKLPLNEYVRYGVYDTNRHTSEDQTRFISNLLHWPITHVCCDMTWQACTEDKWLCSHILQRSEIPIPKTLAVIDKTEREYPGTQRISDAKSLRTFVLESGEQIFCKENRGICSFGAFLINGIDSSSLNLAGKGDVSIDQFVEETIGQTPYLIQRVERNHHFFDSYTPHLATIRVCILVTAVGVHIPFVVLKLPSKDNVADSFWRPGNIACDVDPLTGIIRTVRSKDDVSTADHVTHPETGAPLLGQKIPMFDEVLDVARRCAQIFAPVRYQSMDIAVTPNGPVVIEVNTGGGFDLPQLASGKGFLTDEVIEFFRHCGYSKL